MFSVLCEGRYQANSCAIQLPDYERLITFELRPVYYPASVISVFGISARYHKTNVYWHRTPCHLLEQDQFYLYQTNV